MSAAEGFDGGGGGGGGSVGGYGDGYQRPHAGPSRGDLLLSGFDAAYELAVCSVVDEELMPSDRSAAFRGHGSGPLRLVGDLIPRRRELALRAAFGHLF
jgi:hypothetical protein